MPLSAPVAREHLHTRRYEFFGYGRADGLFDLEASIVDLKTYGFDNEHRGRIEAGEPVHGMAIRLTLDEGLVVRAIEMAPDLGPYAACAGAGEAYQKMVGVRVGPGWRKAIRERVGGAAGCTHMSELLMAMATPAYQTIYGELSRRRRVAGGDAEEIWPGLVDTCHAYRSDGPVVKRWLPERYSGKE